MPQKGPPETKQLSKIDRGGSKPTQINEGRVPTRDGAQQAPSQPSKPTPPRK